jgi:hypothetical protein
MPFAVVKPAADFDEDLENFRTAEKAAAHEPRLEIMAFIEDDFENECFNRFNPDAEVFTHSESMCQAERVAASGHSGWWWLNLIFSAFSE